MSEENQASYPQKRMHPRYKLALPVELHVQGQSAPQRTTTADICLGGFYVETMFTLPVGTRVGVSLWLDDVKLGCEAIVVTNHPQFGNGMHFLDMKREDEKKLEAYLERFPEARV